MPATRRQVLTALVSGVLLALCGAWSAFAALSADNVDHIVAFGAMSLSLATVGIILVRGAVSEINENFDRNYC